MRPRLLPVVAAGALTLSLLVPAIGSATAAEPDREISGPTLPEAPSAPAAGAGELASDALDDAQAIFAPRSPAAARQLRTEGGADATLLLNQLVRVREDLSAAERREADALLARPTEDGGAVGDEYEVDEAPPVCGDTVCIHYVTTTGDAPPLADGDDPGTAPDSVDEALATAEAVNDTYVAAGYRRPDPDRALGGGAGLVDIYLSDLGNQALYGYCATDQEDGAANRWAYCGMDEDFAEFRGSFQQNLRVTLAHEYFHAVQFAYDFFEDPWFLETTATWAEDELYDAVNDNYQYLEDGQGALPYAPLDRWQSGQHYQYGNFIFFRHLTERWDAETGSLPTIMLDMMELVSGRAGDPDQYSTQAVQTVLSREGTGFGSVYGDFVTANRVPSRSYEEGAAYPAAAPAKTWTLKRGKRGTALFKTRPFHLASVPLRYRPGTGTGQRDWRLRLKVDMPAPRTAPLARVLVRRNNGSLSTSSIRLNRNGVGRANLPFSSRSVRYVELLIVNASRRTDCFTANPNASVLYSCYGTPRDDQIRTLFRAKSFRR